jgi:hypothetical protein
MKEKQANNGFARLAIALRETRLPYYSAPDYAADSIRYRIASANEFMFMGFNIAGRAFKYYQSRSYLILTEDNAIIFQPHTFCMESPCALKPIKQNGTMFYYELPQGDFPE